MNLTNKASFVDKEDIKYSELTKIVIDNPPGVELLSSKGLMSVVSDLTKINNRLNNRLDNLKNLITEIEATIDKDSKVDKVSFVSILNKWIHK